MTEREYLAALYSYIAFGPARTKLLLSFFGSAKKAWNAEDGELIEIGLKEKKVSDFLKYRELFDFEEYFARLSDLGISIVTFRDPNYPENLGGLKDSPCVLYFKGRLSKNDSNSVAIVGSRKMTSYGREVTEKFAGDLAGLGITIVSGLARGVDSVAHAFALEAGGRTIAVLGCGLDKIYPPENFALAKRIIEAEGALISEYPLGFPPMRTNFAERNRIISGLSRAVLVIEGQIKSGTLLTASAAAEQGRPVFAVPGQITAPSSQAPLFLIKEGAKMTTSVSDILEELDMQLKVDKDEVEKILPSDEFEKVILEIIANEPLHIDEIVRISSLTAGTVSGKLTVMELKGMLKNMGNGIYKKVSS